MTDTPPAPLDLTEWIADLPRIPDDQFRDAMQALFDERKRREAQPAVTARENEIAEAYHAAHPPEVDEATGHPVWVQPTGAHDAWPIGATVAWLGGVWDNSAGVPNVWEPGADGPVSTWTRRPDEVEDPGDGEDSDGRAPYAVGVDYKVGDEFTYQDGPWRVLGDHTSGAHWPPEHSPTLYERITEETTP